MGAKSKNSESWMRRVFSWLLVGLPAVLYLSYYPIIGLGASESMNFELSVPLVWLVLFDVVGVMEVVRRRKVRELVRKWYFLLFPIFASLSIIWSSNVVRGLLTAGIMWAVVIAIYIIVGLRTEVDEVTWRWTRWVFIGATVVACVWCVVQCVLDVSGVGRGETLMCAGCVSQMFGFPHPNGWAVEPQFMGNLLLAPAMLSMWWFVGKRGREKAASGALFAFVVFSLFLTFSRGAIYAFLVGAACFSVAMLVERWRTGWRRSLGHVCAVWGMIVVVFGVSLCTQGVMAELGPTNETFSSAVAKAVNHLTLGVVDFRESGDVEGEGIVIEVGGTDGAEVVEKSVENSVDKPVENIVEKSEDNRGEAVFDGYVEESTEIRKEMTRNALVVWGSSVKNAAVGVGLGGAGEAMYAMGLTGSPKEIVQNQYASSLMETGVVGVILAATMVVMAVVWVVRRGGTARWVVLSLMAAYGVSLVFFAGLPNALQVYLMPVIVWAMCEKKPTRAKSAKEIVSGG